jgi:hypothetical protein
MRNPETIESLRLRETIANFESKMNSLEFQNPQRKKFRETSASEVQSFLENKIREQNQRYSQKASQNGGEAHQHPSNLFGYKSEDKATQINNLLDQAIHNKGKGSFESRNASAFDMAISGSGKAISKLVRSLSLTSMSSGGNHSQQKSSLQRSQSLSTSQKFQSTQQLQSDEKISSKTNHKNLKRPEPQKIKPLIRKKTLREILSDLFTSKKTETETKIYGTSRDSAKPIKVKAGQPSSTNTSLSRNSSFASYRSGPISRQNFNLSTSSQSFNNGLRSQQSIAERNRSISRDRSSFSSQSSFNSSVSSAKNSIKNGSGGPRR